MNIGKIVKVYTLPKKQPRIAVPNWPKPDEKPIPIDWPIRKEEPATLPRRDER